eukprot:TRINITY_DN71902_c0_g1_i1.p1 TRINITY_DN71902_c0_g1~~TRINITY_DN71902_c0_g1_i1.p1  ORF type:complete len:980 (-),score=193.26 TRINITY_DN71902_c0_g1_i1:158-3073(-)
MDASEAVSLAAVQTPSASSVALPSLSETWEVQARHDGCFTGGKVVWSDSQQTICCLCSEELHLVDGNRKLPTRRVSQDGDGILTFAIDPSGLNACTSHRSGLLRHFKVSPGASAELVRSWRAHDQVVSDVCFDATGALVASGSVDRTVKIFDFSGYFCTHNFKGHVALVSIVRFHPAKLQVVSVADAEVRLWDLNSSTCVGIMRDHQTSISSICFAKAGSSHQLVTGARDQVVNLWRLEDKCSLVRSVPVFESVEGVAVVPTRGLKRAAASPGGSALARWLQKENGDNLPAYLVATVGDKCQLRFWNPVDGRCVATVASPHAAKGLLRQVHCLDNVSGRRLMTIGEDLNLVFWSLPELEIDGHIMGQNEEIVHVQFIPKLATVPTDAAAGDGDDAAGAMLSSAPSPDRFVCIANDEHPRVVDCHGFGASLLRGHTDVVISCDVSADGRWIATGGKDQQVRVWSADAEDRGRCVGVLSGHAGAVSALSFAKKLPKGGPHSKQAEAASKRPLLLVSGSHDKTMRIWEMPSPSKLDDNIAQGLAAVTLEKAKTAAIAHGKEVNDVVVSPNDKLIASAGQDKLVRIWQCPTGELLGECKGHRRGVWCVAFSPTDQVLASASGDQTIMLWNLKDYSPIKAFQGHNSAVLRVCFLAGGMQLMSSGVDGLLKLWQIRTADCASTFEEHVGKVWCIDVVGNMMVSGGSDSKLCVWRDVTAEKVKQRDDAKAEEAIKDSRVALLVREGKIDAALSLALDLKRPGLLRQILVDHATDVVAKSLSQPLADSEDGDEAAGAAVDLRQWVNSLESEQLSRLLDILEQWNSNRKMASLSQMLIGLILQTVPASKLTGVEGMNATCANFQSYSARHMARVDSLLQKTFLFDLVLQSAGGLAVQAARGRAGGAGTAGIDNGAEQALKRTMDVLLGDGEEADIHAGVAEPEQGDESEDEVEHKAVAGESAIGDSSKSNKKNKRRKLRT